MKKIALPLFLASALTACMGTGQPVAVTQTEVISTSGVATSCPSIHMRTVDGLPMRCGPQAEKPYTFQ